MITVASHQSKTVTSSLFYRYDPNTDGIHLYLKGADTDGKLYLDSDRVIPVVKQLLSVIYQQKPMVYVILSKSLVVSHFEKETFAVQICNAADEVEAQIFITRQELLLWALELLTEVYNRNFVGDINVCNHCECG